MAGYAIGGLILALESELGSTSSGTTAVTSSSISAALGYLPPALGTITGTAGDGGVLTATRGTVSSNSASISSMGTSITSQGTSLSTLAASLASATSSLSSLGTTVASHTTSLSSLGTSITSQTASISALGTSVGSATSSLSSLGTAVASHAASLSSLGSTAASTAAALTGETTRAEAAEALALQKASNLSDLTSASAARTNLGLGSLATQSALTGAQIAAALTAGTNVSISASGTISTTSTSGTTTGLTASTVFAANGGSANASLAARFAHRLNVVDDFGADPTGSADCHAAFAAAIAAVPNGGTIYIPSGTYLLNSTLVIQGSDITLEGAGIGATRIVGAFGLPVVIQQGTSTFEVMFNRVRGMTITRAGVTSSNPPAATSIGLQWGWFNYAIEEDVLVECHGIGRQLDSLYCVANPNGAALYSIRYDGIRTFAASCVTCYTDLGNVADDYHTNCEWGQNCGNNNISYTNPPDNNGELFSPLAVIRLRAQMNNSHFTACNFIPRGPNTGPGGTPNCALLSFVGVSYGGAKFTDCYGENLTYGLISDSTPNQSIQEIVFTGGAFNFATDMFGLNANTSLSIFRGVNTRFQCSMTLTGAFGQVQFMGGSIGSNISITGGGNQYSCTLQMVGVTLFGTIALAGTFDALGFVGCLSVNAPSLVDTSVCGDVRQKRFLANLTGGNFFWHDTPTYNPVLLGPDVPTSKPSTSGTVWSSNGTLMLS